MLQSMGSQRVGHKLVTEQLLRIKEAWSGKPRKCTFYRLPDDYGNRSNLKTTDPTQ